MWITVGAAHRGLPGKEVTREAYGFDPCGSATNRGSVLVTVMYHYTKWGIEWEIELQE